jgi:hypothetical protein
MTYYLAGRAWWIPPQPGAQGPCLRFGYRLDGGAFIAHWRDGRALLQRPMRSAPRHSGRRVQLQGRHGDFAHHAVQVAEECTGFRIAVILELRSYET